MATLYQGWCVQHVNDVQAPDYARLKAAGYKAVAFRPEDPRTPQMIRDAQSHGLGGWLWFADPGSGDSINYGIRTDPVGFAQDVCRITRSIDTWLHDHGNTRVQLVQLNIEFTGKGYPTWRPSTDVKAWHYCDSGGHLWQTWGDGRTGAHRPAFPAFPEFGNVVIDGTVTWNYHSRAVFSGWDWNETMMATLRRPVPSGGMPSRPVVVQPMGHQGDFNYGAYLKKRVVNSTLLSEPARISPQCYDGDMRPFDVKSCVDEIAWNGYVLSHYGFTVPRAYIHPSIAPANTDFYAPKLADVGGTRGYTLFRTDYMSASDYTAYRPFMAA